MFVSLGRWIFGSDDDAGSRALLADDLKRSADAAGALPALCACTSLPSRAARWPSTSSGTTTASRRASSAATTLAALRGIFSGSPLSSHTPFSPRATAVHSFLSGVLNSEAQARPLGNVTIDQFMADEIGYQTRFPSLTVGSEGGIHGGTGDAGLHRINGNERFCF